MWASGNGNPPVRSAGQLIGRFAVVGAAAGGLLGAAGGLVIGLRTYLPTAPFAAFELSVPGAIGGALLGLLAGALTALCQRR
jgi:hypothetical protein